MKKIILVILGIILIGMFTACSPSASTPFPTAITDNNTLTMSAIVKGGLADGFGLIGATVTLTGVYAGWSGGAPLTIINGNDQARTFHISLQEPSSSLTDGYEAFPSQYFNWVVMDDLTPSVVAGGQKIVNVTLNIPSDLPSEMMGKKYDVRILVEDWSQAGFLQIAYQQKWLIEFAP